MTVRDALDVYRAYATDLKSSTVKRLLYEVNRWEKLSDAQLLGDITINAFSAFRSAAVVKGLSPRSVESNIDTIRLLWTTAEALGHIAGRQPAKGRRLRRHAPEPTPASREELNAICGVLHHARWPNVRNATEWWRSWFRLDLWTGLRLQDVTWGLTPEHFLSTHIGYSAGKTGKHHVFPLTRHINPDLYCLRYRPGRSPHLLRRQLREFCQAAGIRPLTPKMFRQAAVTFWTIASPEAGRMIHGCGIPRVMQHYQGVLAILNDAAPRFPWPERLQHGPLTMIQRTLF